LTNIFLADCESLAQREGSRKRELEQYKSKMGFEMWYFDKLLNL